MLKKGKVISVLAGKNKLEIILDNSETENLCSISAPYSANGENSGLCGCGCKGCSFSCNGSEEKKRTGLFAVSGDRITVLNKTGKNFRLGDTVTVKADRKKTGLQAFCSVFIPLIFSLCCAIILRAVFKTEGSLILGVFLGLFLGALSAFSIKTVLGDKMFLEIEDGK